MTLTLDPFSKPYKIVDGLRVRFPGGDDPFMIPARLMEESGELAAEIHHFEGIGRKRNIRPEPPNKDHLAKERLDIITAVLHIARQYGVEEDLAARVEKHYHMVVDEGLVKPDD